MCRAGRRRVADAHRVLGALANRRAELTELRSARGGARETRDARGGLIHAVCARGATADRRDPTRRGRPGCEATFAVATTEQAQSGRLLRRAIRLAVAAVMLVRGEVRARSAAPGRAWAFDVRRDARARGRAGVAARDAVVAGLARVRASAAMIGIVGQVEAVVAADVRIAALAPARPAAAERVLPACVSALAAVVAVALEIDAACGAGRLSCRAPALAVRAREVAAAALATCAAVRRVRRNGDAEAAAAALARVARGPAGAAVGDVTVHVRARVAAAVAHVLAGVRR